MRRAVWICASLSLAAHALTVSLWSPVERPVQTQPRQLNLPSAWSTRLTHTGASRPLPTSAPPIAVADEGRPVFEQASPELTAQWPPVQTEQTIAPEPPDIEASSPEIVMPANGQVDGLSGYIPRPQLSHPPVPQAPAIIAPPIGDYRPERITGILSLYIDETGKVHHIVSSGAPMPAEFEEAAKQTFMAIPFKPGILDGAPVKSRIRIEVVFDNRPLNEDVTPPKP